MKKFLAILTLALALSASVFADGSIFTENLSWHKIKENNNEYYNGDTSELELYIDKDNTSISTVYLSYKEVGCSEIIIYIDIDTERANEEYDKFYNMWSTEFKKYIFDDFAKNSKYYEYDSDDDSYYVTYSYIGK